MKLNILMVQKQNLINFDWKPTQINGGRNKKIK
ncbi:hypothetical protein FLBR109950_07565 [Flavobacterium branchiophilum]